MLIREFVQNPAFDVNCYIKIFDCTKKAGWKGKIPVYDGPGAPIYASEDILSMELSNVTTNQHEIILEGIHRDGVVQKEEPEKLMEGHKEKVQKALQALYDAAYQVNQITDEDDYEQFPDLLDESANITNEFKNLGIVGDGIVSLERRRKNMKRNEIFVGNLCLEVTRRCNMGCAHCLRGNAEDLDMSRETIDQVLEQVDMIGQVTFTGGEPSLNMDAIRYFFAQARRYGKLPRSFFVATNGKANQEELAIELLKQYPDMEEQEFCGVALSIDEWHDPQDYDRSILKGLSFYSDCKEKPDSYSLIPEGRAAKLVIDPEKTIRPTSAHIVLSGNSDPDAGALEVEMLYVAADGKITGNCDMSYARIEKEAEYTISGFRAAVDKLIEELS